MVQAGVRAIYVALTVNRQTAGRRKPGQHCRCTWAADWNLEHRNARHVLHIHVAGRVHGHGHRCHAAEQSRVDVRINSGAEPRREFKNRMSALIGSVDVARAIDRQRHRIAQAGGDRRLSLQRIRRQRQFIDRRSAGLVVGYINIAGRIHCNRAWTWRTRRGRIRKRCRCVSRR